jgi:hypothetical protein
MWLQTAEFSGRKVGCVWGWDLDLRQWEKKIPHCGLKNFEANNDQQLIYCPPHCFSIPHYPSLAINN